MSLNAKLIEEVRDRTLTLISSEITDVELVDVKMEKDRTIAIYLWRKEGIDLDTLENYSRKIEKILDEEVDIDGSYQLALSSPDWSKGIKKDEDLRRNLGVMLEFRLREPIDKEYRIVGRLLSFDEESLQIITEEGEIDIKRENIKKVMVYYSI